MSTTKTRRLSSDANLSTQETAYSDTNGKHKVPKENAGACLHEEYVSLKSNLVPIFLLYFLEK